MGQAAYDEGATNPPRVNTSEYMGKLAAEVEQDETVVREHEHVLHARAAARLGGSKGTNFANGVDGVSRVNTEVSNSNAINVEYCWKDSYGRGVGRVPSHCPSHKETIAGGIICYDKCHNFGSNCGSAMTVTKVATMDGVITGFSVINPTGAAAWVRRAANGKNGGPPQISENLDRFISRRISANCWEASPKLSCRLCARPSLCAVEVFAAALVSKIA